MIISLVFTHADVYITKILWKNVVCCTINSMGQNPPIMHLVFGIMNMKFRVEWLLTGGTSL